MRDLAFVGFLLALFGLGLKRPFLFVLAYVYIDIVSPQRLTYFLLNTVPISAIAAGLAVLAWAIADDKRNMRVAPRQLLMLLLLAWCGYTTNFGADFPLEAIEKWNWVWKALAFAAFLPLTLHTRLRIEALLLYLILCASSIIIVGGIKTLGSGGGYGALALMVDNNSGLYEGSTISAVAIALIPLILYMTKHGTVFPPDGRVKLFAYALIFACLLLPVGTEARTGLVCIGVLAVMMLRHIERRLLYIGAIACAGLIAVPLLPESYTQRMDTIQGYKADTSASTRLAVWEWTWDYVQEHPFGGGFEAYRANKLRYETVKTEQSGATAQVERTEQVDQGRAYHSAYFEMLGEQGWPGFLLWTAIQAIGVWRMEVLQRRYRKNSAPDQQWIAPLAGALQQAHVVYLVGALFLGIAYQPFVWMLVGAQIGFDTYVGRRTREARTRPMFSKPVRESAAAG